MTETSTPVPSRLRRLWRAGRPPPGAGPNGSGVRMRSLSRRVAAEAIGTFVLVLIGTGAVMVDASTRGALGPVGVALAFGGVVVAMACALGHVSGAHINPAVTVALSYAGGFPRREVGPYLIAQCIGAVAASLVLRTLLGMTGWLGATLPAIGIPRAFALEWLLSFVLMFVIISVTTDERAVPGPAAIPVGLAVGFGVLVGAPLTGGSMNPARSLGPALAGGVWAGHWIYWAAPVTAMLAAVFVYELLRPAGTFVDATAPPEAGAPVTADESPAGGPPVAVVDAGPATAPPPQSRGAPV
jgi:MIP family channel proteins